MLAGWACYILKLKINPGAQHVELYLQQVFSIAITPSLTVLDGLDARETCRLGGMNKLTHTVARLIRDAHVADLLAMRRLRRQS